MKTELEWFNSEIKKPNKIESKGREVLARYNIGGKVIALKVSVKYLDEVVIDGMIDWAYVNLPEEEVEEEVKCKMCGKKQKLSEVMRDWFFDGFDSRKEPIYQKDKFICKECREKETFREPDFSKLKEGDFVIFTFISEDNSVIGYVDSIINKSFISLRIYGKVTDKMPYIARSYSVEDIKKIIRINIDEPFKLPPQDESMMKMLYGSSDHLRSAYPFEEI